MFLSLWLLQYFLYAAMRLSILLHMVDFTDFHSRVTLYCLLKTTYYNSHSSLIYVSTFCTLTTSKALCAEVLEIAQACADPQWELRPMVDLVLVSIHFILTPSSISKGNFAQLCQ